MASIGNSEEMRTWFLKAAKDHALISVVVWAGFAGFVVYDPLDAYPRLDSGPTVTFMAAWAGYFAINFGLFGTGALLMSVIAATSLRTPGSVWGWRLTIFAATWWYSLWLPSVGIGWDVVMAAVLVQFVYSATIALPPGWQSERRKSGWRPVA